MALSFCEPERSSDGIGLTRMNMDKDKKKETTRVEQGVIVCGQQMATADIALFSRFLVLSFNQTTYSKEEEDLYKELEEINKYGLTHITHQILKTRSYFQSNYKSAVETTAARFREILGSTSIETRIFNNWLSVMSAFTTIREELELDWDFDEIIAIAVKYMKIQNAEIKRNDDLGAFWKIVQYLITSDLLLDGGDYKTMSTSHITWKKTNNPKENQTLEWIAEKNLIFLTTSRIFSLYKNQVLKEGDKPLPTSTIEHYLRHSPAFICETKKEGFKKINLQTGKQETRDGNKLRTSTTAFVFDLDLLSIDLATDKEDEEEIQTQQNGNPESISESTEGSPKNTGGDLPF